MKRCIILLILFLLPFYIFAQDTVPADTSIVGVWKGKIITTDKYIPYEIAISNNNGKLTGYSYTTYTVNSVEMVAVRTIKVKNENGNFITEDDGLLFDSFDKSSPKQIKQTNTLSLKVEANILSLTGNFTTKKTKNFRALTGDISLQKENDLKQTQIAPKLNEMKLLAGMSFMKPVEEKKEALLVKQVIQPEKVPTVIKKPQITSIAQVPLKRVVVPQIAIAKAEVKAPVEKPVTQIAAAPVAKKVATVTAKAPVQPKAAPPVKTQPVAVIKPPVIVSKVATIESAPSFTAALAKREIETIQTVFFKTDSLMITLYDNGTVDGDTVSVILDGKMIMPKQGLSTNPVNKTIYIPQGTGDSMQLVMYAENLGSIPPNTGLLIIRDGSDRYEIRFAGDLTKNAAIILRRKKPDQ